MWPTVYVGLVTGSSTPSARAAPRTNVVLPAPSSPETVITSPDTSSAASAAAMRSVSSGEADSSSITKVRLEEAELLGGRQRRLRNGRRKLDHLRRNPCLLGQELREAAEVVLERTKHGRGIERSGRVVERIQRDRPSSERCLLLATVHTSDPMGLAGQELRGEVPERRDQLRLDQLDLAEEVRLAGLDLVRLRIAVARRAALDHVRDVHVLARQADPLEELVEELARLADERIALLVFVEARGLPDEQEVCVGVSDAENDLRAARRQPAARAGSGFDRVRRERGAAIQNLRIRSHSPRRSSRPQKVCRSWAVRRCRESRRRRAVGESSQSRTPGTQDRQRPAPRAPRSGSRTSCTRTRRSASPRQFRQVPGRTANGFGDRYSESSGSRSSAHELMQ